MSSIADTGSPRGLRAADGYPWTVHLGDARHADAVLRRAAASAGLDGEPFLQTTVTSPPYATLVDYGPEGQIGFGQSYEDYLASCRDVFAAVHRHTKDDGSLWVVADTLLGRSRSRSGVASRLIPLPFDLAKEAEAAGWTMREVIVWRKDRTRPWSHPGKLRNGFEYVLFFVKTNKFKFEVDRLRDTASLRSWWVKYPERHNPWGMTPDNVWEIPIPVQGSWDDTAIRHACPFPPELVRRMIALSTDEGDVVFDPFAGTGSVVSAATRDGRRGLGIELNPEYIDAFLAAEATAPPPRQAAREPISAMTRRLIELRMLKYPKELAKQLKRNGFTAAQVRAVTMKVASVNYLPAQTNYAKIECVVLTDDGLSEIERARLAKQVHETTTIAPLSRYGLDVDTSVRPVSGLGAEHVGQRLAVYTKGRTWYASHVVDADGIEEWIRNAGEQPVAPVISSLHVEQPLEETR